MTRSKAFFPQAWWLLPVFLHLLFRLTSTAADPDLWHNLFFGRMVYAGAPLPWKDTFTYVPVRETWLVQNWLAALWFYTLHLLGGDAGIQLFRYAMGLVTGCALYLSARRRGASLPAAATFLLLVSCSLSTAFSPIRPQVFTYLFYVLVILLLDTLRRRPSGFGLFWLAPLGFAFWANLHAGVFSGLWLAGSYALADCLRQRRPTSLALFFVLCCLATLLTPYGTGYWVYALDEVLHPAGADVSEWLPLAQAWSGELLANSLLFVFSLGLVLVLAVFARKRDYAALLVLALTAFLGFGGLRHQVFFLLSCGAYAPELLDQFATRLPADSGLKRLVGSAGQRVLALAAVCACVWWGWAIVAKAPLDITVPEEPGPSSNAIYYPVKALDHLQRQHPPGKLLPTLQWGSYALWRTPEFKLGMDGRFKNTYTNADIRDYFIFLNARPGWKHYIDAYPPDYILLRPAEGASFVLRQDPQWRIAYEDRGAVLFVRADAGNLGLQ